MGRATVLLTFVVAASIFGALQVDAIGQSSCVSFKSSSPASFSIVSQGNAAPIFLSADEWPGVQRAAADFATDIHSVTNVKPALSNATIASLSSNASSSPTASVSGTPIIIGTLGKSSLIEMVVNHTKLDVSRIQDQWESFMAQEVANPLPGIAKAYVIIGADKRGTIYAMYDHSEQFGVSPWYWWADVPTTPQSQIFVSAAGCSHGSPTVKYRGIFLNDEQPALQNWAMEKFTNGTGAPLTGSPFNHLFYTKLFELLLRIKANFLWPAIWSSAFAVDDSQNQPLADWYGIVMGTSHQEPMMRSTPIEFDLFSSGPWDYEVNAQNIYNFWVVGAERAKPYESIFTIGMRGAGDEPLAEGLDIQLLETIVSDQRQILTNVFNGTNVTTIPQVWCLYEEVEGFYDDGMRVPDDVTLLWTDDTWGNIRRLPTTSELNRTGGAGVYYHLDLVGPPRDYKWITSTQIPKVYEQMSLAVDREATRVWVLNVGDLKPYERETEFFITYGWNSSIWNPDNINTFVTSWAQREFDISVEESVVVSEIVANLTRFNSNRKPELLNSTTYSLINYREADNVLAMLAQLNQTASSLYNSLSPAMQPSFFQLVLHPVQATATLATMWISAGMNNMRASQARLSTNDLADQVETLFEQDYDLEEEYHTILGGKWDHMMDQTHVMYYYWQQPMTNTMPFVSKVSSKKQALPGPMRITPEGTYAAWPGDNMNQCAQGYNCPAPTLTFDPFVSFQNRYIDVSAGGPNAFTFTASSNTSWLKLSATHGSISPTNSELRIFISVPDWSELSVGANSAQITFNATAEGQPLMSTDAFFVATKTVVPSSFKGFIEGDGYISVEAAHASRNTSVAGVTWKELPGIGKTLSGVTPWPRLGNNGNNFTAGTGPSLEYDFYNFNTIGGNGTVGITTLVSPSLNTGGADRPIALALQVDSQTPQTMYFIPPGPPGEEPPQWNGPDGFVANSIVSVNTTFEASPGAHTFKIWMVEPAVVVQKILINTGGLQPSYLGPPESISIH